MPFYTIEFDHGRLVVLDENLPETMKSAGEQTIQPYEEIQLTYKRITWTFVEGGFEFTDQFSPEWI